LRASTRNPFSRDCLGWIRYIPQMEGAPLDCAAATPCLRMGDAGLVGRESRPPARGGSAFSPRLEWTGLFAACRRQPITWTLRSVRPYSELASGQRDSLPSKTAAPRVGLSLRLRLAPYCCDVTRESPLKTGPATRRG
jgi:hypothetical protein